MKIFKSARERVLILKNFSSNGRNNCGHITSRHRGGGCRQNFRIIDFKRKKQDSFGIVTAIRYDPNRNVQLALLRYQDGSETYILRPKFLQVGSLVWSGVDASHQTGNSMSLSQIPLGMLVHNVEIRQGFGGQLVRSAGTFARVLAKENLHVTVRLPSGEVRLIHKNCHATIGQLDNRNPRSFSSQKAGWSRWLNKRPHVRGSAMNPVDHPHGGGEGRCSIGRKQPVTPWGKPALGFRTRKRKKYSTSQILRRRQ